MTPENRAKQWIAQAQKEKRIGLRALEEMTGISRSKLGKMGQPGSKLSVSDAIALGKATGHCISELDGLPPAKTEQETALDDLMKLAQQRFSTPRLEDISEWLEGNGGYIDSTHPFAQHMVLVNPVSSGDEGISVNTVGPLSLTAKALESLRNDDANDFVRNLPDHQKRPLVDSYASVHETDALHVSSRDQMPTHSDRTLRYFILIRSCILPNGKRGLANFASLVSHGRAASSALAGS